jgi:D-aminoacyl-tRNA deacylase
MRVLLQRVSQASVVVDDDTTGSIGAGLLVLVGIEAADTPDDVAWLVAKTVKMRIFSDDQGKMNLSVADIGGCILVVSQFTLHASTVKGNRPSFIQAARPEQAIPLYEMFCQSLSAELGKPVATGVFGADMKVSLLNDGPVTIWMDSKMRD